MNLEMEKKCELQHDLSVLLKNHWILTINMDFHSPFLGECSVHLPNLSRM
jgi:hypothetical protein